MKKTLVAIAALLITASSYGQGTVNFGNRVAGLFDAPINIASAPTRGIGEIAGTVVQLIFVNGTSLTPVGTPIPFRGTTGALVKYFDGGQVEIPGTTAGGTATLRVRVSGGLNVTTDSAPFT
jgi:PPE-repeat protein